MSNREEVRKRTADVEREEAVNPYASVDDSAAAPGMGSLRRVLGWLALCLFLDLALVNVIAFWWPIVTGVIAGRDVAYHMVLVRPLLSVTRTIGAIGAAAIALAAVALARGVRRPPVVAFAVIAFVHALVAAAASVLRWVDPPIPRPLGYSQAVLFDAILAASAIAMVAIAPAARRVRVVAVATTVVSLIDAALGCTSLIVGDATLETLHDDPWFGAAVILAGAISWILAIATVWMARQSESRESRETQTAAV